MRGIHILAGCLGLLSGYIALFSRKGGGAHRRSGTVFVGVMLVMALFGMALAVRSGVWVEVNVPAGWTTAYLVLTGYVTIRRPAGWSRGLDAALLLVAGAVATTMLTFGVEAVLAGGKRGEIPAFPFFLFGVIGLLGAAGDARVLSSGLLQGRARLARHLWRVTCALLIAAMSFFLGQAKVIPEPIRIIPLLAVPVLTVLVAMFYWLWRVRRPGPLHGPAPRSATRSTNPTPVPNFPPSPAKASPRT
jgi:hypothetical protein